MECLQDGGVSQVTAKATHSLFFRSWCCCLGYSFRAGVCICFPNTKQVPLYVLSWQFFLFYVNHVLFQPSKQLQYSPGFIFHLNQSKDWNMHVLYAKYILFLTDQGQFCIYALTQLAVLDLRNISDKCLVEISVCKPLDLMNQHSLDKQVFLKLVISRLVLIEVLDIRCCG